MMQTGTAHFIPGLQEEKKKYSWARMCAEIINEVKS
jgi:hypothetical protein